MRAPLQFVLDFFTGGDPVQPTTLPSSPPKVWVPPVTDAQSVAPPSTSGAVEGSQPQTDASPCGFTHPAANRHAQLQGVMVSFRLERSRRKSIGFLVGADGLVVRAPGWVPLREVDAAVKEKAAWIVAKLQQFKERQTEQFQKAIEWRHGAEVPFLGRTVQLCVLERGVGRVHGQDLAPEQVLPVTVPPGASVTQVRDAAQVWLKKQAKTLFEARLHHFAPLLGVRWQKLSLSSASTRWGSARTDGHIRLNWRLIHLPISQIDYVVVHELAHLREMNHSPRFWETVGEVMPDYAERRKALRQAPVDLKED
ncbi:M48 family metallopeptidase [Limnohabitans sp. 63ED37-2]|uniref:M48 family metallopeptidase n=1 Tax=Limnohabitans sp. 63ED37-2 TaxID=1678128 RepID=UPI000705922D|nr:SprT family zinc-dependent metalloprotease [Limnohabitans sp. 63ED37-2]ALK90352.1 WLM domain protein [Limnohabitans sp. 63ED37-2]